MSRLNHSRHQFRGRSFERAAPGKPKWASDAAAKAATPGFSYTPQQRMQWAKANGYA